MTGYGLERRPPRRKWPGETLAPLMFILGIILGTAIGAAVALYCTATF